MYILSPVFQPFFLYFSAFRSAADPAERKKTGDAATLPGELSLIFTEKREYLHLSG